MRYFVPVALLVLAGCAPVHVGEPQPCGGGDIPESCIPSTPPEPGTGMFSGCGGLEWEAYDLVIDREPFFVRGCRVTTVDVPLPTCRGGFTQCADGDYGRCGIAEVPDDETCAAMLAQCDADRCRFPFGWEP
jgi:hypothetical protein